MMELSYRRHRFPPVVIQHAVWLYLRFTLSGAVEHAQEMAAHDEAVRLHQGTAYQVDVHQGQDRWIVV
jgi:transposase-like protein